MSLKILIVDPENKYASACKVLLQNNSFECQVVISGKEAQVLCAQNKFFAILISTEIQNFGISQVLKFVKSNQSSNKIISYCSNAKNFTEMGLDKEKILKLGASDFIDHQPTPEEVKDILEGGQSINDLVKALPKREGQLAEQEVQGEDSKFSPIRITDFYAAKNVIFDVYIKLGSKKYLKILHTGDVFSKDRLEKYKNEKKIEHLYIATVDRKKFVQWNNFVLEKTLDSKNVAAENKLNLLRSVSDKYIEEIYTEGMKPQMLEEGKSVCENTYKMIEKEKDLHKLLKTYQDMDPSAYSRFFLISLFSGMVVKFFSWQSKTTIETIAMAAMMHDLGKLKMPEELRMKRPETMSAPELEIYKQHPQMTSAMLEGNRLFSTSIKQIVLQHHEAADGSGFPFGIKDQNILPLSKILFFVAEFVDKIMFEKITPVQGVVKVLKDPDSFKKYNRNVIENFTKVFMDPDKVKKNFGSPASSGFLSNKK